MTTTDDLIARLNIRHNCTGDTGLHERAAAALREQRDEIARIGQALGDAARELGQVAGPVDERIRIYRRHWQDLIEKADAERDALIRERDSAKADLEDVCDQRDAAMKDAERYRSKLFELGVMEDAPCFFCGYNGPGYFQPTTHPCAAEHHAAMKERP